MLEAVKLTDRVYWVGAIDWELRSFHGYLTSRGSSYNAYLVLAEKVALIDTVKGGFGAELMERIASVIDPGDIDYIISNHSEMDHSGYLCETVARVKPEKVFASRSGVDALKRHYRPDFEIAAVGDGEKLSLGDCELTFVDTRMVHWPDSMFTYLTDEAVLFSQDAFGMHLASFERYADELPADMVEYETAKYYANIVIPFAPVVGKLLARLDGLGLKIDLLATDHGPIWRRPEDIANVIGKYAEWSAAKPTNKAVVVYDTMWGSTAKMARAVAGGLAAGGVHTRVMPIEGCHRSDVATELLGAAALLVGTPTLNRTLFPTVADVLTYLRGLGMQNLVGGAFGSYGWSGQGTRHAREMLESMGVEIVAEAPTTQFVPDEDALASCKAYGLQVAERVKQVIGG